MNDQPSDSNEVVNTGGGPSIKGNVNTGGGDFAGRDKLVQGDEVHGEKVGGDKITVGDTTDSTLAIGRGAIATSVKNFFFGSSEDTVRLRNRQVMLKLVYDIWVKGVLEHSLYNQLLIDLDMEQRPEAVDRPWGMMLETPAQASRLLPSGTKMVTVFAELNQSLLILGEPGSGKSTMLLELARDLLAQAAQNPALPIPVLFNLSSWAEKRQPLHQWLVDELREKYQIPKTLAQTWVEHDELLLLFDGLDEVKQAYRNSCIKALNEFQQSCTTLVPLALCSRVAEYEVLTSKLKLNGAIVLRPLRLQQMYMFLRRAGGKLNGVTQLLRRDAELRELVQSPLTFNIMCLTYQDKEVIDIEWAKVGKTRLQQLFNTYIMQMFQRTGKFTVDRYPRSQTLLCLAWLAARMLQYSQTEFLIERLQPNWLQSRWQRRSPTNPVMLLWGPLYGVISGLIFGLIGGSISELTIWLTGKSFNTVSTSLIFGPIFGVILGLTSVLIDWLSGGLKRIRSSEQSSESWKRLRSSMYAGLFWGLGSVTFFKLFSIISGIDISDSPSDFWKVGLISGLSGALVGGFKTIKLVDQVWLQWKQLTDHMIFALRFGVVFGLVKALVSILFEVLFLKVIGFVTFAFNGSHYEQVGWLNPEIIGNLILRLVNEMIFGLILGLIGGLIFGLIFKPYASADALDITVIQKPKQGIKRFNKISLTFSLLWIMISGSISGLILGLSIEWISRLLFKSYTSSSKLNTIVTQIPNQGIKQVGKFSLTVGLISGLIGGVSVGLIFELLVDQSFGQLFGQIFGLFFAVICGLVSGGDILVKHLILRLALYLRGYTPLNYANFLDYCVDRIFLRKVGGGYIFVHRLLLEHFAVLNEEDIKRLAGSK